MEGGKWKMERKIRGIWGSGIRPGERPVAMAERLLPRPATDDFAIQNCPL